ncbi:MAG: TonB-dependent siderophore receptor [Vicinamibacterales bacterium]
MRFLVLSFCLAGVLTQFSEVTRAEAQAPMASAALKGAVLDPSRAPMAAVTVIASPAGPGPTETTTTDARGAFQFSLAPGSYTVKALVAGFAEASETVSVASAENVSVELVLQIAGLRDSVTVSGRVSYAAPAITSATKTPTPLRDVPQAITVVTKELIKDQMMTSVGDVMRYVPGIAVHQGENNRDQVIIRGNSSSADFFVNGVRDDVQYYRDIYNVDRVEALKGPNAMMFGRGGAGGVVNRVMKEANFRPTGEFSLQGGMFGNKRVTGDIGRALNDEVAFRLNGMFEDSGSFRDGVTLNRRGITPTVTFAPSASTTVAARYEYLDDSRVADRGITSFKGAPANVADGTFYGNPSASDVAATVNMASTTISHRRGALTIRNHTSFGGYDRFYQNFVPGAVSIDGSQVTLTSYNNTTQRKNLFNQTDVTYAARTGAVRHTLLGGAEFGNQDTVNFRNTGYFNNTATSVLAPFASPTITTPVTFRQSLTDADNHLDTKVAAVYAQDQVELSRVVQVVAGLRFDRFDLTYHNNRNGDTLSRSDDLLSPRVGVVVKPMTAMSIYSSYSVSYLPSSGDQFSSLTTITEQVKPEKISNYEVGAKWDLVSGLSLQTAAYQLNRTNTRSTDPNDPTRIVQTGGQRTNGFEFGLNGNVSSVWKIAGGYSYQDGYVTSATTAAVAGAQVAQVPHHTLSLWNNYQITPTLGAGLGILQRTKMFATIDNSVTLPGYTRADAAVYFSPTSTVRLQANVENLFDKRYYINADSNTNISPGFPRTLRVALTTTF